MSESLPFLYVPVTRRGTEPQKCWRCGRTLVASQTVVEDRGVRHYPDCVPDVPNSLVDRAPTGLRAFAIYREGDSSGVSGTGTVLEGVVFSTGAVVVHWLTPAPKGSINVFDSWAQFVEIHLASHPENRASVLWADGELWGPNEILGRSPFERKPPSDPWSSPHFLRNRDVLREEEAKGSRLMSSGTAEFFGLDRKTTWGWQFVSERPAALVVAGPREVWRAAIGLVHAAGHPEIAEALEAIEADLPAPDRYAR